MVAVTTLPASGDWTVDDLDGLPDDGLRYELVDGVLLVSPAPRVLHQLAQAELLIVLAGPRLGTCGCWRRHWTSRSAAPGCCSPT